MGRGGGGSRGVSSRGGGGGDARQVVTVGDLKYTTRPGTADKGYEVVYANVSKLDQAWQNGRSDLYIDKRGKNEIDNRRDRFSQFLKEGGGTSAKPIEMSKIVVNGDKVIFKDGRHRFSVLRDQGKRTVPILVQSKQIKTARELFE